MMKSEEGAPANPLSSSLVSLFQRAVAEPHTIGATIPQPRSSFSCMCKKSNCLKLYCECFANGVYCSTSSTSTSSSTSTYTDTETASYRCRCEGCCNNARHERVRREAIEIALDRNPHAFRPKIISVDGGGEGGGGGGGRGVGGGGEHDTGLVKNEMLGAGEGVGEEGGGGGEGEKATRHLKGCHCKRSHCLKKYCECYQAFIHCSERCRCTHCQNYSGSTTLAEARGRKVRNYSFKPSSAAHPPPPPSPFHVPTPPLTTLPASANVLLGGGLVKTEEGGSGGGGGGGKEMRARLEENASNLSAVLKPQLMADMVMLLVNAAWVEGEGALLGGTGVGKKRPRPQEEDEQEEGEEKVVPAGQREKGGEEEEEEEDGLGCTEEGLELLDDDDDDGLSSAEVLVGKDKGKEEERPSAAVLLPGDGVGSSTLSTSSLPSVRHRQEVSVLEHLHAGLQRLVDMVVRGKRTGGAGGESRGGGGRRGTGASSSGSNYAYARRVG